MTLHFLVRGMNISQLPFIFENISRHFFLILLYIDENSYLKLISTFVVFHSELKPFRFQLAQQFIVSI